MKHLSAILALSILLIVGLACGDSSSDNGAKPASSDSANANSAKSDSTGAAVTVEEITLKNADDETVTSFKTSDKIQKVAVKFSETGPGKVKGVFTAVNAGGEKNFKILEKELDLGTLMNTATFTATIDNGFPAGDYKFDIYVGDKLAKTQTYKVQ